MNARQWNARRRLSVVGVITLVAGLLLSAPPASAGVVRVKARPARTAWMAPAYETRPRVVTVPAVYETRPRRIWHEPIYEVRRVLVTLPAKVVTHRVPEYGFRGPVIGYSTVTTVIEPAREVWRDRRILVQAGYYETIYDRILIKPATTRTVFERVLVTPGHRARPRCASVGHRTRHAHRMIARPFGGVHPAGRHGR